MEVSLEHLLEQMISSPYRTVLALNKRYMKDCKNCQTNKELSEFYKDSRRPDGLYTICKQCHRLVLRKSKKKVGKKFTPREIAKDRIYGIDVRIRHRKAYIGKKRLFTLDELEYFFIQNWDTYTKLHIAWEESGHKRGFTPSLDRIDEAGDYSLDNIQLISQSENSRKAQLRRHALTLNTKK